MKKKRFSLEQIVAVLKQAELGVQVAEVIRSRCKAATVRTLKTRVACHLSRLTGSCSQSCVLSLPGNQIEQRSDT